MSNPKIEVEMTQEQQQEFLKKCPTREEVMDFTSAYLNNEVIPLILNSVGKELFQLRCRTEVLLRYCVNAGLCTTDQFEKDYTKYLKEQQEIVMKRQQEEQAKQESKIIVPDKTIVH